MGKLVDDLGNIVDGWKNYLFRRPDVEAFAERRARICLKCEYYSDDIYIHCKECDCPIATKTRSRRARCPKGYW